VRGRVPDLTILMPVYDERATVEEAIRRALDAELPVESRELVVVDDGSTDGTRELLRERDWGPDVRVVFHDRNQGKGRAVRTAIEHAEGTWSTILDADLEYDPADIADLLEPLRSGDAEVVFGTRGFASHSSFSFWYVVGNKVVTMVANVLFDSWLADIMTCHKAMRTELWRSLDLSARGFELEGEITAKVLASGRRVYEVPITYRARGREEGKKLTGADGLRVIATLARERLRMARQ
jgi:glycosyltransferase involved in cell wall biosynthesis